jgi:hypothetical protein
MMRAATCFVLASLAGCLGRPPSSRDSNAPAPLDNSEARAIVDHYCAKCHDGSRATAKPAALAVFDLRDRDWTARMTDAQLREAPVRLAGTRGPTRDTPATPSEVATLRVLVDGRLAARSSAGLAATEPSVR